MMCLTQLRKENPDVFTANTLQPCLDAVERIGDVLSKLRATSEYRTVPYGANPALLEAGRALHEISGVQILAIGKAEN